MMFGLLFHRQYYGLKEVGSQATDGTEKMEANQAIQVLSPFGYYAYQSCHQVLGEKILPFCRKPPALECGLLCGFLERLDGIVPFAHLSTEMVDLPKSFNSIM
jgi:hypothetical protein